MNPAPLSLAETSEADTLEAAQSRETRLRDALDRIAGHAAAMQADAPDASAEQLGFSYIRVLALRAQEEAR